MRRLADRAKIPLEYEKNPGEQQSRHLKERLLQIHEQIAQRWQHALANEASGQIARDYLAKRGVPEEAIKLFRLGSAPDLWDDTVNWARSKGHELALVEQAGLVLRKQEGEGYYDRFRGRLMFPICDEQGRVIGFSGRVLSGDEKTAKYVNSPETPIFTKSKVFFGLDKSKRAVLEAGYAVVCEGQLDLIACFMADVRNVVAPQGTAFTADHARILRRYVDEVVLCFDSDEAGQNATVRSLDSLLASGLAVRVAVVPDPHDPDSFIKTSGGAAFKRLIERADGFFDYYLNRLCAMNEVTTDKGRLAVLRGMAEAVHKTANVVLVDKYAQKTALRLGVTPDAVRAEFKKLAHAKPPRPQAGEESPQETTNQPTAARIPAPERWLLRLLLTQDDLVGWVADRLDFQWLQHPMVRRIVEARIASFRSDSWKGVAGFLDSIEDEAARGLVAEVVSDRKAITDPERVLKGNPTYTDNRGILERLRGEFITRQLAELQQRANQPECGETDRIELLRQQAELRRLKRQPLQGGL